LGAEFTTAVAIENLNLMPIKYNENINQKPFIDKVNQILDLKKENSSADTLALEKEIDKLVYELYGLTDEEIKIVEGV
jgi:hypothetical protein